MRTDRGGFTFIELVLVMLIGVMLLGGAYRTLYHQEEAYRFFNARVGTQQDTRLGVELLSAELRELSTSGSDLLMATPDSLRIRALRKFGLLCTKDKNSKNLTVAQIGADPFVAGDSLVIYLDQDSLKAADDVWHRDVAGSIGTASSCTNTLGASLPSLLPNAQMTQIGLPGSGLRFDSVYPGAPIRSFENLLYREGTWQGENMLMRVQNGTAAPMLGPISNDDGLVISYFDTLGTQLTSFPLSAAARGSVGRLRIEIRAERQAQRGETYTDSLITDVYLRGS